MESNSIVPGIRGEKTLTVAPENTAAVLGSGCLPVCPAFSRWGVSSGPVTAVVVRVGLLLPTGR